MRRTAKYAPLAAAALALALATTLATPADAQRRVELGIDAAAVFGLGDQSSVNINLPGSRFRMGFFQPGSRISIEPAVGLAYNKVEGADGIFRYDLELGALYHFRPIIIATADENVITARATTPYVRPFVGLIGLAGGESDDSEVSAGVGLGTRIPWRNALAWRLEANVGYGFDNDAARIGVLAGLSFFPR